MASVETEDELQAASEMGWSTFRILHEGEPLSDKERMCPHITHGIQCVKCNLCRGSEPIKRRIAIGAHGSRRSKFRSAELSAAIDHSSNVIERVNSELPPPMVVYQPNEEGDQTDDQPRVEVIYNGSKIISSIDLLKMDFETLPFEGQWFNFLGEPSSCFHMAVFGRAGQGKSSFSVQVANYLVNNFGSAIYVSGEEGFCLTFQKKFRDYGAASPNLDVADIRAYSELVKSIEPGRYRFILLDSLDTLKITAEQLRELKLRYKDCAFITISQVTKSGDARGSYQVMHDADIIVEVIHGKAITIKNRFHPTEKLYPVFK